MKLFFKLEKYDRKANMTYQQAFQLCKQKRRSVDPISAFCEQLKRYEQECRELGYLTAIDAHSDNDNTNKNGSCWGSSESAKKQSTGLSSTTEIIGSKRKVVEASGDVLNKKRLVGPSIGPSRPRPSIGPSRPSQSIGPTVAVGPGIGPPIAATPSQKAAPIGPLRPPPVKKAQVDKDPNNRK